MRIIVCGGRDFTNTQFVRNVLDDIHNEEGITEIIQGGARGADRMALCWAMDTQIPYTTVNAEWDKYGKAAGPIRNQEMIKRNPDLVIAFDGGRGTESMVRIAHEYNVNVLDMRNYDGTG